MMKRSNRTMMFSRRMFRRNIGTMKNARNGKEGKVCIRTM